MFLHWGLSSPFSQSSVTNGLFRFLEGNVSDLSSIFPTLDGDKHCIWGDMAALTVVFASTDYRKKEERFSNTYYFFLFVCFCLSGLPGPARNGFILPRSLRATSSQSRSSARSLTNWNTSTRWAEGPSASVSVCTKCALAAGISELSFTWRVSASLLSWNKEMSSTSAHLRQNLYSPTFFQFASWPVF